MALEPVVEAEELYRFYHVGEQEIRALRGVSLRVEQGEIVAIAGPSGSGKSTLLACLTGLDEPDGGMVNLNGQRLTRKPEIYRTALRARNIGIFMQSGNLFDHLTVEQNLRLVQRLAGRPDEAAMQGMLGRFGLQHRQSARPIHISGGEAARAGLAAALINRPALLVADEPTGEVDAATEALLIDGLLAYRGEGGTLIIATHSQALAARADRVVRLLDGKVLDA